MRRFNYDDNEEYREDVDNFFGGEEGDDDENIEHLTPEEYKALMEEENEIQRHQIGIVQRDLNHRLLGRVIRMAEKSFLWRFYSVDKKMKVISQIYENMFMLENGYVDDVLGDKENA